MSRIPRLTPAELEPDQAALYQAIAGGPRATGPQLFRLVDDAGRLEGPFNAFLLQPALGSALQALGSTVRYQTHLDARIREIAILVVAAQWDSAFERYAHEAVARSLDLTEADLAGLRRGDYGTLREDERLAAETAAALAAGGDLDDAAYDRFVARFGRPALFELLTLVGYYGALALQLRVFRVAAPGV
ncbi:carboxymuconolactone decarboxylase family protein [Dactylosporangium sp. NBC_01737]|uniref:carboxymuconolactone decarboxylase family protein n=1 Tax=Dactylosporangium sp. NBC_01737 TaxID=2975959 RepID=UPI002E10A005|nr:carboxymuconolactone decarboxylase family protein [Dactylosporangium sp. NBC_01737]